jgi:hypothetical protein
MAVSLGLGGTTKCSVKSIYEQLADLYSRRSAVESLIRCLESYAECQARCEGHERPELKRA